ncbi:flagellar filament capping protein FliD [Chromatiaceae bacterium AAb-1]|nr:flagellar filament capping protein FliD [Chromatiaceae bacterium AAb-1]
MSYMSIDPARLAYDYTQIDRAGKDKVLSTQYDRFNGQLTAIKSLQTSLSTFLTSLKSYQGNDGLLKNTATSSNDSTVKVTASASAVAGDYEIFVEQLAQQHQLAVSFDPNAPLPTDGEFSIDLAGQEFSVDLSSLPAGATVAELAKAINNHPANEGVRATLLRSGSETYLVLTTEKTGAANQISLNFSEGTDPAGADITAALANTQELKKAQDAIIRLGSDTAIPVTSASNTLENVIEGVTLDLLKVQTTGDSPVRISIGQDQEEIKANIKKFVDEYNSIMNTMSTNDHLKKDSMVKSIQTQFRAAFQGEIDGKTLYSIGLEFDRYGKLSINNSKLEKALTEDPQALESMLTGENGLLAKLETTIEPYTKTRGGLINEKQKTLQASLDIVVKKRERHDYSMEQVHKRYLTQFTQMQITIAQLETSMAQLRY